MRKQRSEMALIAELRSALEEYQQVARQANGLKEGLAVKARLVRDLTMIVEFHLGRPGLMEMLDSVGANGIDLPFAKGDQPMRFS